MSQELSVLNNPQTMSSREIAELTGKEHRNVMRDIREMLINLYGEGGQLKFEHTYFNSQNKELPEFMLDREHTDCLLTGYSAVLRMKVIKRWYELEANQLPRSLPEALRLAADLAEKNEALVEVIDDLETRLDESDEWLSQKRVEAINGLPPTQMWRKVRKISLSHGYDIRKVNDQNYGEVNAYHISMWEQAFPQYEYY